MLGVGVDGVAVAAEGSDTDVLIFEFLLPGFGLTRVSEQVRYWTVRGIRVAASADLHRLESERGDSVEHLVEREVGVGGVKHADGDFLLSVRCFLGGKTGGR